MDFQRRHRFTPSNSSDSSYPDSVWTTASRSPKRSVSSWRQDPRWQFVWPNDKPRGRWGRWKDILTNKGPDIFIAEQNTREPELPIWCNWKTPGHQHPDDHEPRWGNRGRPFNQDQEYVGVFDFQRRDPDMKYDFATRRYCRPHDNVWTGIIRSRSNPNYPIWIRDVHGYWIRLGH